MDFLSVKNTEGSSIYGRKLVKIPTPRFAVFYNGDEKQPEQYELKLSDAFEHPVEKPEIELTCRVYNINYGKNQELLSKCSFLKEYMTFVDYVRENHRENGYEELEHSIEMAIDRCIKENVLREFLMKRRTEVVKVMKLDYSFDRQLTLEREDSRAEGELIGVIKSYKHLVKSKEATMDYLIETYHLTKEKVTELINKYWDNV